VHGGIEGAVEATEGVMRLAQTVDADADVVVTDGGDVRDIAFVDQRAIGRQTDIKPIALARFEIS